MIGTSTEKLMEPTLLSSLLSDSLLKFLSGSGNKLFQIADIMYDFSVFDNVFFVWKSYISDTPSPPSNSWWHFENNFGMAITI